MKQKKLSKWLKLIMIGAGIVIAVIFFVILPDYGMSLAEEYPEFAGCFWPWLILFWICVVPLYITIVLGWFIAVSVGDDRPFTGDNARRLKWASRLIAWDGVFFFAMNIIYGFAGLGGHPAIFFFSLLVLFAALAMAVVFATLSHLVGKAASLQEQSDLTI